MTASRPNFLVIMSDQQRADTVLSESVRTPHLDQLRSTGVTFSSAFASSPHCCPSRVSFFSGLYPSQHGVWNNVLNDQALSKSIRPGVRLWNEDLSAAGYDTHYLGKWHLSATENPEHRAWSQHTCSALKDGRHGRTWADYRAVENPEDDRPGVVRTPGYGNLPLYLTEPAGQDHDRTVAGEACELIESLAALESPWCIYAGLFSPHDPYTASPENLEHYAGGSIHEPQNAHDSLAGRPEVYRRIRDASFGGLTHRERIEAIRHYRAACTTVDNRVGEILEALSRSGQAGNTVVIFTSDHGDYAGEHGLFCKGIAPFDGAYRVPLVICAPGGDTLRGALSDALVSLTDVAPTILDLARIPYEPDRFYGRSLSPLLTGAQTAGRQQLFMQCNGVELYYTQRMVRNRRYKYVFNGFAGDELYDLAADPGEMVNLAGRPEYQATVRTMCCLMWSEAYLVNDGVINDYFTVRLAPVGPASAFGRTDRPDGAS